MIDKKEEPTEEQMKEMAWEYTKTLKKSVDKIEQVLGSGIITYLAQIFYILLSMVFFIIFSLWREILFVLSAIAIMFLIMKLSGNL